MKLSKSLTRVTGFSKLLAFVLLLAFIVTAFYMGMMFQKEYSEVSASTTPTPTKVSY